MYGYDITAYNRIQHAQASRRGSQGQMVAGFAGDTISLVEVLQTDARAVHEQGFGLIKAETLDVILLHLKI